MKYSASFTAGALLFDEINRLHTYILADELELKRNEIIQENIIKINSEAARKRVLQEIRKREKAVEQLVWIKYDSSNDVERKILLYYVVVKTYPLFADFIREVVIPKWKSLKLELDEREIEVFLDKKSVDHQEIEGWSITTKAKVIQVIQRMLREAGLLVNGKINSLQAADSFWKLFISLGDNWFLDFALLNNAKRNKIIGV